MVRQLDIQHLKKWYLYLVLKKYNKNSFGVKYLVIETSKIRNIKEIASVPWLK